MRAVDPVRIVVCAGTPAQQSATKKWTNRRMVESTPGGILRPRHSTVPRRLFDAECLGDGPDTSSRTTIPVLPAGIPSRINGRPTGPGSGVRTTGRMGANPGRRHPGDLTRRCSHRAGLAIPARNRRDSLLPGGGNAVPVADCALTPIRIRFGCLGGAKHPCSEPPFTSPRSLSAHSRSRARFAHSDKVVRVTSRRSPA